MVVGSSSFVLCREAFSLPNISFFLGFRTASMTTYLPCIGGWYRWAVSVGGEELK